MFKQILTLLSIVAFTVAAYTQTQPAPAADHHQHLFSPAMAEFQKITSITAQDVITLLDAARIERAVLLSTAYAYGRPGREPQNEYEKVKEENDWVGAQAALFPKRLIGFCGFNPLKEYALSELERCSKNPNLRRGIKMHFGNSDVQLQNAEHIEKLKAIFRAANANRMSMVIHMRASISLDRPYGSEQAQAFLRHLLPMATDITVQIAHLGSAGPGYNDPKIDAFMDALIGGLNACKGANATRTVWCRNSGNLWFDVTTVAHPTNSPERSAAVTKRIREIGVKRILYGTDAALGSNLRPRESWTELTKLGLTSGEIKTIARNRAPYLRE
ncbi:MAG TPA: amidohydrolase family protein [Pyrinomonadaceae bacterium]